MFAMTIPAPDLTGQRFGRWTALQRVCVPRPNSPGTVVRYDCVCDCGRRRQVSRADLSSGHSQSCGCLRGEMVSHRFRTHGLSRQHPKEFTAWKAMRARVRADEGHPYYPRYKGRGIVLDKRWDSFENFYADMGDKPSALHSLDRIDNDGPYGPENCRWATRTRQNRNKRGTIYLTLNGRTQTMSDWADEMQVGYQALYSRYRRGWPDAAILDTSSLASA